MRADGRREASQDDEQSHDEDGAGVRAFSHEREGRSGALEGPAGLAGGGFASFSGSALETRRDAVSQPL